MDHRPQESRNSRRAVSKLLKSSFPPLHFLNNSLALAQSTSVKSCGASSRIAGKRCFFSGRILPRISMKQVLTVWSQEGHKKRCTRLAVSGVKHGDRPGCKNGRPALLHAADSHVGRLTFAKVTGHEPTRSGFLVDAEDGRSTDGDEE